MGVVVRFAVVVVAVVIGATIGSFIGWRMESVGGRYEQENVWLIACLIGGTVGAVAGSVVLVLRGRGR